MFEEEILDVFVHLLNGVISFKYSEKFLSAKFEERKNFLIIWSIFYATGQIFLSKITETWLPHERFLNVLPYLIILFALQKIFFVKNFSKQFFVVISFTAGWEILRFAVSPLAHVIFSVWSPAWAWLVNFFIENEFSSAEKIISVMMFVNRSVIFVVILFCRAVQFAILFYYLRLVAENFSTQNYQIKFQDNLFLIFPCGVVLLIDLTVRLMAFSADNGAVMLIYDRVPATVILLPIVSLFLLGMIISSTILFRHLVEHKAEEQKRILLENRVEEVHKEISELEEIYSEIRGLRHDLRNHLENIFAYVRKNSVQSAELENYLKNMTKTVEKLNFTDKTGNAITDIILHRFRQQARKKNIHFTANFICPKNFDVYDLSVILNNALQNAIEATEKISGKIEIKSYERGKLFFIEIENNFVGELEENFATTKSEKILHGIGLENIRRTAKKYLGDFAITISEVNAEKIFKLTVMLCNKT